MRLSKGQVNFDRFIVPYRIYGEGEQLLVCVSGVQQTMASWRTVVSYFAHDYRLLLFDMPGQGRSQILSGPAEVSIDEQVYVLRQILLDQDNPIKPIVIGASWGGIVVAILAARHPDLVDKIVLASFSSRVGEKLLTVISVEPLLTNKRTGT